MVRCVHYANVVEGLSPSLLLESRQKLIEVPAKWFCDACKAVGSTWLRKPSAIDKECHDPLNAEKHDQVRALTRGTAEEQTILGDQQSQGHNEHDLGAFEKIDFPLAASRSDFTTTRQDSLITCGLDGKQNAGLASEGPSSLQDFGKDLNPPKKPECDALQVESARQTRPMMGEPEDLDEKLPSQSDPAAGLKPDDSGSRTGHAGLMGVAEQEVNSQVPAVKKRRARKSKRKPNPSCIRCK